MITGNEPVTPHLTYNKTSGHADGFLEGITIRQHFAAMAMQGYCGGEYIGQSGMPHEEIANWCVKMADALIAELNKSDK